MVLDEETARTMRVEWNNEEDAQRIISVQMVPVEWECMSFGEDHPDEDGDIIFVEVDWCFDMEGLINLKVPQGASPQMVARVLRKFAAMFDGERGRDIANLGVSDTIFQYAVRLPDGEVAICEED